MTLIKPKYLMPFVFQSLIIKGSLCDKMANTVSIVGKEVRTQAIIGKEQIETT